MKNILFILLILSGCAITYETPRCELMSRGEPCLTDHRCCDLPQAHYEAYPNWYWWYWNKPTNNKTIIIQNNNSNKPNRPNNRPNNKPNKNRKR